MPVLAHPRQSLETRAPPNITLTGRCSTAQSCKPASPHAAACGTYKYFRFLRCLFFFTVKYCCHRSAARLTLNGYQNEARGARIVGRHMATCVGKDPAQVLLSAQDSRHVLGLHCITQGMSNSPMPIPK